MGDRNRRIQKVRWIALLRTGPAGPPHLSEIQKRLIDAERLDRGRESLQNIEDLERGVDVLLGITLDADRVRTEPQRLRHGHASMDSIWTRRVARRRHDAAPLEIPAHQERLPLEARIQLLLDRGEKRVHVDVQDDAHDASTDQVHWFDPIELDHDIMVVHICAGVKGDILIKYQGLT